MSDIDNPSDPPPTLDKQWTAADLANARDRGDYRRISDALDSGRLDALLQSGAHSPDGTPARSTPLFQK